MPGLDRPRPAAQSIGDLCFRQGEPVPQDDHGSLIMGQATKTGIELALPLCQRRRIRPMPRHAERGAAPTGMPRSTEIHRRRAQQCSRIRNRSL